VADQVHHADRDHAQWSASSTERNWNCSGALALTDGLPETTSEAADWGTCCHQIAEKCLTDGVQAAEFIGTTQKGKKYEFDVDDEMADTAQVYVDYVRQATIKAAPDNKTNPATLLKVEQKFSLADLNPPFDAGGTADAVIYSPAAKHLEVVDLKGGRGHVVEVVDNKQLRTYALGAMLANRGLEVQQITVTIVQPRAPHKSGRTRSETFHVADLLDWTIDLVAAMNKASAALENRSEMSKGEWNTAYLRAGDHCKFCKAAGFCPALEQRALDAAGVWFDDIDQPRLANSPDDLSPEKLAKTLDSLDMIGEWINAVRAYAHAKAEEGVTIPGYQLVDKIGNRAWKVAEEQVVGALVLAGLDDGRIYNRKLVTPAQAEKALGAKKKGALDDLVERPVRGTNLVAADKTTRPAATPKLHQFLDVLE